MGKMKDFELRISDLALEIDSIGHYGIGYLAGVLVERRLATAKALYAALELTIQEEESKNVS